MIEALGFNAEIFNKIFNDPKAPTKPDPRTMATQFYIEIEISGELGLTLKQWSELPVHERKARIWQRMFKAEKEDYAYQREQEKAKFERENRANRPALAPFRP